MPLERKPRLRFPNRRRRSILPTPTKDERTRRLSGTGDFTEWLEHRLAQDRRDRRALDDPLAASPPVPVRPGDLMVEEGTILSTDAADADDLLGSSNLGPDGVFDATMLRDAPSSLPFWGRGPR
jgi:hypothetical protein